MRRAIVAIGGGTMRSGGTAEIDAEIIRLTGRKRPRALFIGTASYDAEDYWQGFQKYYGGVLKCRTDVLRLSGTPEPQGEIEKKILGADVIYVGGGNTLYMMRVWRRLGVDRLLRDAYQKGIVLCGISAGSICWFDSGHSDSLSFYDAKNWKYINVRGLGLIHGIHCPHYNGRTGKVPRRSDFRKMMGKTRGVGIAIENNCAIEFIDGRLYRVIRSGPKARAYRVIRRGGVMVEEPIAAQVGLAPLEGLYEVKTAASVR